MSDKNTLSVDELLAQATCAIIVKVKEKYQAVATAWLASDEGHLVTAGHTSELANKTDDKILVKFLDEPPVEAILKERVYKEGEGLDFAILKLDLPTNRIPLRFILVNQAQGEFKLRGYGKNLPRSQSGGKGEIRSDYFRYHSSKNKLFQLLSPELAHKGFSGGAVYSTQLDAVVAIQTEAKKDTQTILAMPLIRIVEYWADIEKLASLPGTCFVIAPKERLDKLTDEIVRPVVAEKLKYEVKTSETGRIGKNDLDNIQKAELIVADVTGNNPDVIYELAVSHSAGIPDIILGEGTEADYKMMPFKVTTIELDDVEAAKKELGTKIGNIQSATEELKSTPTNLVIEALRVPLTQISPAYGLALGHFHNFVEHVGKALQDDNSKITFNGRGITDEERETIVLSIVIPKHLHWADHKFMNSREVKNYLKKLTVSASVPGKIRPFTLWALKDNEGHIELIDIFPTAMGVIAKSIDSRLSPNTNRRGIAWRELEDKEITRFSSSLSNLIQSETELTGVVKVKSWETIFPRFPDTL